MRILIHTPEAEAWREALVMQLGDAPFDAEIVTTETAGELPADYLIAWKPPASLLAAQDSRLKAIFNAGAGVDALLANPELPADVPIVRLRDAGMGEMMGDYLLYALLHFQRDMDHYRAQQQAQHWQEQPLADKSAWPVGILGLGTLGSVAGRWVHRCGYPVRGWSRAPKNLDGIDSFHGDAGLDKMLADSRMLFNLLPDTPATRGLLNERRLRRLMPGAVVVNAGRGATLVADDLLKLLDEGHLRGALLDVFAEEPLPATHPLWHHPRVIITPHVAAPTPPGPGAEQFAADLLALARGERVETVARD
ncbi:NAD(P)-dependent oxidoreductase [Kushneria aurantia]|uniref:NAD(P)-dependent oxidoreductase n=1 Tax=Kushneria aurantia TaxID=504092 RepID=A0ABV6G1U8_9GAMM|nr:NAD(P)-dependent oxidoreductase [Kushneria aurantia]